MCRWSHSCTSRVRLVCFRPFRSAADSAEILFVVVAVVVGDFNPSLPSVVFGEARAAGFGLRVGVDVFVGFGCRFFGDAIAAGCASPSSSSSSPTSMISLDGPFFGEFASMSIGSLSDSLASSSRSESSLADLSVGGAKSSSSSSSSSEKGFLGLNFSPTRDPRVLRQPPKRHRLLVYVQNSPVLATIPLSGAGFLLIN